MKVKDAIYLLSKHDPEEIIALDGWWYKEDVDNNNDIQLDLDEWKQVVERYEKDTTRDIDEIVWEVLHERGY